jgi:hypothetical protein
LRKHDTDKGIPADDKAALEELATVLESFDGATAEYDLIPNTVRKVLAEKATPSTTSASRTASSRESHKASDDVDELYENIRRERGDRPLAYEERVMPATVEAINKAAKHDPPFLPDFATLRLVQEHGPAYVPRDKQGYEKAPDETTRDAYLGEGGVLMDALVVGHSYRSDNPAFTHIKFTEIDYIGKNPAGQKVNIGAKISLCREVYGRLRAACELGKLTNRRSRRAVLKFHRLIDQWLITNGGTLNQAVVSHEMNAYLSQLNERAEARGERRRREARSENSPRSRTDAKVFKCFDKDCPPFGSCRLCLQTFLVICQCAIF